MFFEKLQHQKGVVDFFQGKLKSGRLPHAFLFTGSSNDDGLEAARALAKFLFCEDKKNETPCELCVHCRQLDKNSHPDYISVDPGEDSDYIRIEQIRHLIHQANLKPYQASAKVFVIAEADRLNEDAQNAFLKTLEEPSGHTFFILICHDPSVLLATVQSRLQVVRFTPAGSLSVRLEEAEAIKTQMLNALFSGLDESRLKMDFSRVERSVLCEALQGVMEYFRDLLLMREESRSHWLTDDSMPIKRERLNVFSQSELIDGLEKIGQASERIMNSGNVKLVLFDLWKFFKKDSDG